MPAKKERSFFSLPSRGKHRVRKGLGEALGAFGLKPQEDDSSSTSSSHRPPSILVFHPEERKSSLDMSIFSHLKKDRSRSRSPVPDDKKPSASKPSSTPHIANALPVPRIALPEKKERRMSAATSTVSTIAEVENDHQTYADKAKASVIRQSDASVPARNSLDSTSSNIINDNELAQTVKKSRSKLHDQLKGSKEQWLAAGITSDSLFSFIANERLRRMPAQGSRWDKLLRWAEDFAKKSSLFEVTGDNFIVSAKDAVELIYGCLQILLLLGPENGEALERAFAMFHEYGMTMEFYKRNVSLLVAMAEARRSLSLALGDLVWLAVDMAILYRKTIRSISTGSVTIDFTVSFGRHIESFANHKNHIAELMWTYQLKNSTEIGEIHVSIDTIRQWLLPQDRTLQTLATTRRSTPANFSCEWFDRSLVDFIRSKDKFLTVSAEAGTGKTALYNWILERLQRRVASKEFHAIQAIVDAQVPTQASQLSLVKSLLLQLLDQNVGNVALYRCLANVTELSDNTSESQDAEDAVWYTLDTALKGLENVVLVIDGLDALKGDEAYRMRAFAHLNDIANKNNNVRVILLTKPLEKPWPQPVRQVTVGTERTTPQVKEMVRAYLLSRRLGTRDEVDKAAEQVAQRSKGSITWADLALQRFTKVSTLTEVLTTAQALPSTTKEVVESHLATVKTNNDARLIFSWLLISKRPLTVAEIQTNLELDVTKGVHQPRSTNIVEDIKKACGSLVVIQDKTVRFRNEAIRLHLLELSKKQDKGDLPLLSPAEAHKDFATRLLLYVKVCVTRNTEPNMGSLSPREVENMFASSPMLEYAARNWLSHFKKSSYFANGKVQASAPAQLKGVFPNSTMLALLERSCWDKQTLASKANARHLLALDIRKQALGESAQSVLQGYINVAQSYKKLSAPSEASKYFYQAAKIGQTVLGKTNDLAVSCATASLDCSANVKSATRDDTVNQREELLKYVVETEKQRYGNNSSLVSKYNNQLAQLYADVKENDKAEAIYRDVYQATISQNGKFSQEATAAAEKLQAVLYKEAKHEDVVQYTQPIFESAERDLDIFDIRRVQITLKMAEMYEQKKDLTQAEELYISLWRGLAEYCRSTNVSAHTSSMEEAHERKIEVSLAYARFLRRQGRQAEAQNILHGVWLDYQHLENKSEALVKQLNAVGEELKAMGILDVAIAVFKNVWGYFKSSGKQSSAAAVETAVSLMGAVQEKSEKKAAAVAAKKASTAASGTAGVAVTASIDSDDEDLDVERGDEEAEAIMDEVVAAAVAAPVASKTASAASEKVQNKEIAVVTVESQIKTCETLSSFYVKQKRWTDSIEVCSKLLKQIWPDLGVAGKFGFPKDYRFEAVKFARRLAVSYTESNQTQQAEQLYIFIFQSAVHSRLRVQDALFSESAEQLIEFRKRTQQYSKALEVYQQLLESYRTTLGARNTLTLKTLWTMGDFCMQYRLKGADRYYLEITKAEKPADGVLSKETLRAAAALCKIYYEQKRWTEARAIYSTVWTTYTKRAKEYGVSAVLMQTVYMRYVSVLQTYLKVDVETVRQIAAEYREICTKVYGADAEITTTANLALAEISRKSSNVQHQEEAVKICEAVVAKAEKDQAEGKATAKSTANLTLVASAKRHLAALYATQTESGKAPSPESAQKAEALWKEQVELNKKQHGVAHKATLSSLASLVTGWARAGKPELQVKAQQELQKTVVEVVSESCAASSAPVDSTKLHDSAVSLAKTYLSCNLSTQAWGVLRALRWKAIAKGTTTTVSQTKTTIPLPENVDRRALVFVAAFEETLREAEAQKQQVGANKQVVKVTFSDIMTDMLTEGILYDRYNLSVSAKDVSAEQKLFDGARLYAFLVKVNREQHAEQVQAIEESLFKLFMEQYGAAIKTQTAATRAMFLAILVELGQLRHHEDLISVACTSVTAKVYELLETQKFDQAADLATSLHHFLVSKDGFKQPKTIPFAFKLSLYLAGLGTKSIKLANAAVQTRMLELSKSILRDTLAACKTMNIDLVQLQAAELNNLVRLMGEQKNYEDLEWLLTQLWNSRIIQASWSATTVIAVGRRLVEVLFVRGKHDAAIALAQSMTYNLRRTWGLLDGATVELENLLSTLFVSEKRYADALDVHEEILRAILELNPDDTASTTAGDPDNLDEEHAATLALQQLELVRTIYARSGGWPSEDDHLSFLITRVAEEVSEASPNVFAAFGTADSSKWSRSAPAASDTRALFIAPLSWEFDGSSGSSLLEVSVPRKPSYMLRSLQITRQRSFGDFSEARKRDQAFHKSGHAFPASTAGNVGLH